MKIDGDTIKFRNGREEYANLGIIGIRQEGNEFLISGGYDEGIIDELDMPLTKEERVELSQYMIAQWKLFAEKEII